MIPARSSRPRVLLVNPWIHDFAAYDFWARPLGLLTLGGALLAAGIEVTCLDLVDPCSPHLPPALRPRRKPHAHGKFVSRRVARPRVLPFINRQYRRYGTPPEIVAQVLAQQPAPDFVFVTSMMTYWYTGVGETIACLRRQWPKTPIVLGGVYGTLCTEHAARVSGADHVVPGSLDDAWPRLADWLALPRVAWPADEPPLPAYHLAPSADSAAIRTSRGCPWRCPYCGVHALHETYTPFAPAWVERVVRRVVDLGIQDLALYDDAFLFATPRALDILERLRPLGDRVRWHAASGLSGRGITPAVARALKAAGFTTLRLGLETADDARQRDLGGKITTDEFLAAVDNLRGAGFAAAQIGVYVMAGLPGQRREEVEQSVDRVLALRLRPHLTEYSPVPGSPLFEVARQSSAYDLSEPLFHNPTLLPCAGGDLSAAAVQEIKVRINRTVETF